MPTAIISEILQIGATLLAIFSKAYAAHNDPAMVLAAVQQLHQGLKDKLAEVDRVAADPKATPADHQRALDSVRLAST